MTINLKQALAILIAVLAVLMISSANLTDLFGADLARKIVSAAAILNGICGGTLAIITGQAGTVKDVLAMPGVESIKVNAQASQALAQIATDPEQPKIGANSAATQATLQETAKG